MSFLIAAVDVVAQSPNVYLDPLMDKLIAGVPAWMWLLIAFMFIMVMTNMWWLYKRMSMKPVLGYLDARKAGQPQTLFLGKNRAFMIKYLEYIDSVLAYKKIEDVAKWLVQSPKSVGRLGGLSIIMVRDNFDYSLDPVSEIAICKLATDWNKDHSDDPLNNYRDFERLRVSGQLEAEYPEGITIGCYNVYDPSLIQKYLPQGRSAGTFGSHLTQKARDMKSDKSQEKWYERYIPLGVAVTVSILMLALAFMYGTGTKAV